MNEQEYLKLSEIRQELYNAKYERFCNTISYSHFETMVNMMNRLTFPEYYSITCNSCMLKLLTKTMTILEQYEEKLKEDSKVIISKTNSNSKTIIKKNKK